MDVIVALQLIVKYQAMPALNYAVNYAKHGLTLDRDSNEFRVQMLYVANNISNWRATKAFDVTKEQIQQARKAIKAAGQK